MQFFKFKYKHLPLNVFTDIRGEPFYVIPLDPDKAIIQLWICIKSDCQE